jgi:hypothetical protein
MDFRRFLLRFLIDFRSYFMEVYRKILEGFLWSLSIDFSRFFMEVLSIDFRRFLMKVYR